MEAVLIAARDQVRVISDLKHGFEANALVADLSLRADLGAAAHLLGD